MGTRWWFDARQVWGIGGGSSAGLEGGGLAAQRAKKTDRNAGRSGKVSSAIKARQVWEKIGEAAWTGSCELAGRLGAAGKRRRGCRGNSPTNTTRLRSYPPRQPHTFAPEPAAFLPEATPALGSRALPPSLSLLWPRSRQPRPSRAALRSPEACLLPPAPPHLPAHLKAISRRSVLFQPQAPAPTRFSRTSALRRPLLNTLATNAAAPSHACHCRT